MEERIDLTEKELAIGMWEYIKRCIRRNRSQSTPINITFLKYEYLKDQNILGKWKNNCILCSKYRLECSECPLGSCRNDDETPWSVVTNGVFKTGVSGVEHYVHPFTLEERLEACDKIIEAIKNDVPDDYKS